MEKLKILAMILICILLFCVILKLISSIINSNRQVRITNNVAVMQNRLEEKRINITTPINIDTVNLLDTIISLRFTDVLAHNIDICKEGVYINGEIEKKLRNELADRIQKTLSPALIDKISLIYDINNLDDIIADKIVLKLMEYKTSRDTENITLKPKK